MAVGLATGAAVLASPACDPMSVVFLDYEMSEDDLHERLLELGYDESSDLSRFNYYLLPAIPPLDTLEGGKELAAIVDEEQTAPGRHRHPGPGRPR